MKKAYIFRGSPASGKTTITKIFGESLEGKKALLELDLFRWNFHLIGREINDVSEDEHKFAYENFLIILERYCQNGNYNLILEGFFSWSKVNPHGSMKEIMGILKKYEFDCYPILLKADYEVLWQRNHKREYSVPKDEFDDLYHNVMDEINEEEIVINVDTQTPKETLDTIKSLTSK